MVWVHLCTTHPGLASDRDRVAHALEDAEADVTMQVADDVSAELPPADVLVCVVADCGRLVDDATQLGESLVREAIDRRVPIHAYDVSERSSARDGDVWAGYASARAEWLRRRLRRSRVFTHVGDRSQLPQIVVQDLAAISRREIDAIPDVFRALHRRARKHRNVIYDAFSISMHNVDQFWRVPSISENREVSGSFVGAEPGGAGANAMVVLSRLGLATAVAGVVGDDAEGVFLRRALDDDEVATVLLLTTNAAPTGRTVMLRGGKHWYSTFVDAGANGSLSATVAERGLRHHYINTAASSRLLHLSSFGTTEERRLQRDVLHQVGDDVIVSYKPGAVDAQLGLDDLKLVLARCDVLFVAEGELDLLLSYTTGFDDAMRDVEKVDLLFEWRARCRHNRPFVVAVMAGKSAGMDDTPIRLHWGCERREASSGPESAATRGEIVDEAGARDAIVAGVLFGLLRSRPPIDCVNVAYVMAMSAMAEAGCRGAALRRPQVREQWRALIGGEPPRWLDPYG